MSGFKTTNQKKSAICRVNKEYKNCLLPLTSPLRSPDVEGARDAHAQKLKAAVCMTCTGELNVGSRQHSAPSVMEAESLGNTTRRLFPNMWTLDRYCHLYTSTHWTRKYDMVMVEQVFRFFISLKVAIRQC